jgi:class 3 adenylate cyclase
LGVNLDNARPGEATTAPDALAEERVSPLASGADRRRGLDLVRSPEAPHGSLEGPLAELAVALEETGWATALVDADWRLVWMSSQLRGFIGEGPDEDLGLGTHFCAVLGESRWRATITEETRRRWLRECSPYVANDTPGGMAGLRELVAREDVPLLEALEAAEPPPLWGWTLEFLEGDLPAASARCLAIRHERGGSHIGTALLYGADLPATLLALLARGDRACSSAWRGSSSRHGDRRPSCSSISAPRGRSLAACRRRGTFASSRQAVMTAADDVLAGHQGIVGKHVGDGATGFFLSEDLGSDSATARAAIDAGRGVMLAAQKTARSLVAEGFPLEPEEVRLRVGLHRGWSLYMGQAVRGSRLEVSALGDEVNECARIERSAPEEAVLASKALVERLEPEDAKALGIDRDRLRYRALLELPDPDEKVRRDAGGVAVADVTLGERRVEEDAAGPETEGSE